MRRPVIVALLAAIPLVAGALAAFAAPATAITPEWVHIEGSRPEPIVLVDAASIVVLADTGMRRAWVKHRWFAPRTEPGFTLRFVEKGYLMFFDCEHYMLGVRSFRYYSEAGVAFGHQEDDQVVLSNVRRNSIAESTLDFVCRSPAAPVDRQ